MERLKAETSARPGNTTIPRPISLGGIHGSENGDDDPHPIHVQKFLGGVDYPADKASLVKRAKESGADQNVLNALNRMSEQTFNSPNDVSEEMGKLR